jgi:hypothetical protein
MKRPSKLPALKDPVAIAEAAMRQQYAPQPSAPPALSPPSSALFSVDVNERRQRAMAAHIALIEQYMEMLVAAGYEAQSRLNGRELAIFERDFEKIATLVGALVSGNYLDTSCRLADIAYSGVRAWLKAAEDGDERYALVARLIRTAEAIAESEAVGMVRAAGADPRFWTAPATWLERKFPHKYGRRQDDNDGPKVQVIIGAAAADVKVNLVAADAMPVSTKTAFSIPADELPPLDRPAD